MDEALRRHLTELGRQGGRKSRRTLTKTDARRMVRVREARRAYRRFHTRCFWSFDPNYIVTEGDIEWVVEQLKKNGDREAWQTAVKLCR